MLQRIERSLMVGLLIGMVIIVVGHLLVPNPAWHDAIRTVALVVATVSMFLTNFYFSGRACDKNRNLEKEDLPVKDWHP